jgi:hypothetical protein
VEHFLAVRAKLPVVIYNAAAAGTMAFQFPAAIRATEVHFLYRVVAARAFQLLFFSRPIQQKNKSCRDHQNQQQPEKPAVKKISAMPAESP